jgi:4-amino-4-deoxy-L-arabinose transferase-like glycosyltransferase
MKKYSIYLILLLAFALRLYHIDSPVVGHHSWRQADTAAMARNYYENGYNFLYPQIDWGGNSPGYLESEFPIYQFIVALCYKAFGFTEFWGRFLSVIFSIITLYYLYKLVKSLIDEPAALWSCFFLALFPRYMFFSRTIIPDITMIMFLVLGVYFFLQASASGKKHMFLLSSIFISLAVLTKIYVLFIGLPLLYLAWLKFGKKLLSQWVLWVYSLVVLIPVGLWYYHAHQIGLRYGLTVGIWSYGTDKWGNWDIVTTLNFWNEIIIVHLARYHFTYAGFIVFLIGLFIARKTREEKLFDYWLIATLVFFIIVAKGNYIHDYYQLPFLIPASVYIGKVYSRHFNLNILKYKKAFLLTVSLIVFLFLSENNYYRLIKKEIKDDKSIDRLELGETIKQVVNKNALIVVIDRGDPTIHYLGHRKGWIVHPDNADLALLSDRKSKGASYAVGLVSYFKSDLQKQALETLLKNYEAIFNNGRFFIIKL